MWLQRTSTRSSGFGLLAASLALLSHLQLTRAAYLPLLEYAGPTFFDRWEFWGNVDNTTWGNVTYNSETNATQKGLIGTNALGNVVIKVDNTNQLAPAELVLRDSVRITSIDKFDFGTLIIADFVHMPYGCSVWPSFWTLGDVVNWPIGGEIDIVEGINQMTYNQVAIHGSTGCTMPDDVQQTGRNMFRDCSTGRGCIVAETKANSFGPGFAAAGGGVFAVQYETQGIFIWFWSRPDVPENIRDKSFQESVDVSSWGLPTAAYPNGPHCPLEQYYVPQSLVLLTTLCGMWAGVPNIYQSTCPGGTGHCFNDNVLGPPSNFDNAYWEIKNIRTYYSDLIPRPNLVPLPGDPPASTSNPNGPSGTSSVGGPSGTGTDGPSSTARPNGALARLGMGLGDGVKGWVGWAS